MLLTREFISRFDGMGLVNTHTHLPLEFHVPLMNFPTTGYNWTQFICLFLLVLLVTVVGMWWLLPSVGKPYTVCVFE